MKILLTGPNGFVGSRILNMFRSDIIPAPSLRDATEDYIRKVVEESNADAVIHTAAVSDTRACEEDPDLSYRANVILPVLLARASRGKKLVCFSSDQVYTGCVSEGPYVEADAAAGNIYAAHKLEMEERVLDIDPDAVMLRAEWMYDCNSERQNYIQNVLDGRLTFSRNQYRGVTYLKEVAEAMPAVLKLPGGAYNFGSETDQSMYDITQDLLAFMGRKERVEDCSPGHNLWMDCSKAAQSGVKFSSVPDALKRCVRDYHLA